MMERTGEVTAMPTASEPLPLGEHRARVLQYLREIALPRPSVASTIVRELRPPAGRRFLLRPGLVLWACSACNGESDDALAVAAAFDLFDGFMLLHDQLVEAPPEANPDSLVARWGLGQSLNAGDALYAMALRALAQDVVNPPRRLRAAALVTRAVLASIEGRTSDIKAGTQGSAASLLARVRSMRRRSAVLTGAALVAGAVIADAPFATLQGFDRAGRLLDVAATSDDPAIAQRLVDKAVIAVESCIPDRSQLAAFEEVAGYVAARAA
jgi:geranylgeranyl pyrophosphate synthase